MGCNFTTRGLQLSVGEPESRGLLSFRAPSYGFRGKPCASPKQCPSYEHQHRNNERMCDRKQAYFDSPCSLFSEELVPDVSLDESLSESDESLESDEEPLLASDEAELDSASGRAGAVDSAFSASETFFFNDSGTGIIPSFTIYWRHWRMQLFSLKTSSLSS